MTKDNLARAEYKLREYRNQIAIGKFGIPQSEKRITFAEASDIFSELHGSTKENTRARKEFSYHLKWFKQYFKDLTLDAITPQHVFGFRKWRESQGVKYSTVNRDQAVLCSLFNRFEEWNEMGTVLKSRVKLPLKNPCKPVKKPSELPLKRERIMSPEEWERLVPHLSEPLVDLCRMGLYSSLRLKDILNLAGRPISGDILRDLQAKTRKVYQIPLTQTLRAIAQRIAARPRTSGWLVQRAFRAACQEANIQDLTFRDLRRTGLNWLDKSGFRRTAIRDKAGHANSKTTDLYLVSDMQEQLDGVRRLEEIFK